MLTFHFPLLFPQSYAEREHGKVVVYTTSMGVVRQTYQRCLQVSYYDCFIGGLNVIPTESYTSLFYGMKVVH